MSVLQGELMAGTKTTQQAGVKVRRIVLVDSEGNDELATLVGGTVQFNVTSHGLYHGFGNV